MITDKTPNVQLLHCQLEFSLRNITEIQRDAIYATLRAPKSRMMDEGLLPKQVLHPFVSIDSILSLTLFHS